MEVTNRPVNEQAREGFSCPPSVVDTYLAAVRNEQHRYMAALADAVGHLESQSGQVAHVAAFQTRLTQQLFDAQRLIFKRRADAHAAVVRIARQAEDHVEAILRDAHERTTDVAESGQAMAVESTAGRRSTEDLGIWSASDGLALAIERAFDREADELAVATQLRMLLDDWWRVENQEDQAAIDDANARAAMRVHLAQVEARDICGLGDGGPSRPLHLPPPISMQVPTIVRGALPSTLRPPTDVAVSMDLRPRLRTEPLLAALLAAEHDDLDEVLASLFDTLTSDSVTLVQPMSERSPVGLPPPSGEVAPVAIVDFVESADVTTNQLRIRCDIADIEQVDRTGQEMFDRFWGAFNGGPIKPFSRDWILVQVMLPAVGVVAVLALVMAWVG